MLRMLYEVNFLVYESNADLKNVLFWYEIKYMCVVFALSLKTLKCIIHFASVNVPT